MTILKIDFTIGNDCAEIWYSVDGKIFHIVASNEVLSDTTEMLIKLVTHYHKLK